MTSPRDLIQPDAWQHLTGLATDVLLRTTDHFGTIIEDMQSQASIWLHAMPLDPKVWPFFHDAYLDTYEEFDNAPLIAAQGLYRQATACLRNALEVTAHAARYAVKRSPTKYDDWRQGRIEPPKFGNSVDVLGPSSVGAALDSKLGPPGLFAAKPPGVLRTLYADVCRYAHGAPGATNGDIWSSNGPVFVPRAFTQFWLDYCDTFLACYALLKLAYPALAPEPALEGIAGNAGGSWYNLATNAVQALGLL